MKPSNMPVALAACAYTDRLAVMVAHVASLAMSKGPTVLPGAALSIRRHSTKLCVTFVSFGMALRSACACANVTGVTPHGLNAGAIEMPSKGSVSMRAALVFAEAAVLASHPCSMSNGFEPGADFGGCVVVGVVVGAVSWVVVGAVVAGASGVVLLAGASVVGRATVVATDVGDVGIGAAVVVVGAAAVVVVVGRGFGRGGRG
jgi:hypothetical protein